VAKGKYSNWYADRRWRRIRAAQLQKEPLCRYCQKQGRIKLADVADHIEPHKGDKHKFYYGALQSLCHLCHSSVKQREEGGKGPVGCDLNGWPLVD
jgi:5-methylcytosine-specific restriction enzyme A